jgi:hypothetical protein
MILLLAASVTASAFSPEDSSVLSANPIAVANSGAACEPPGNSVGTQAIPLSPITAKCASSSSIMRARMRRSFMSPVSGAVACDPACDRSAYT